MVCGMRYDQCLTFNVHPNIYNIYMYMCNVYVFDSNAMVIACDGHL